MKTIKEKTFNRQIKEGIIEVRSQIGKDYYSIDRYSSKGEKTNGMIQVVK